MYKVFNQPCQIIHKVFNQRRLFSTTIQYVSDVHVSKNRIPKIDPVSDTLLIAGDIGNPNGVPVQTFLQETSKKFKKVIVVAGNHDYNCGALFNASSYNNHYKSFENMCDAYDITLLNNNVCELSDDIVIVGSTLWSQPRIPTKFITDNKTLVNVYNHLHMHNNSLKFINNAIMRYNDKKIVMLTHYVPSHKLIEDKYKGDKYNSLFASDLDYLINNPIVAWICGHTHSVTEMQINDVYCGINAYGYKHENEGNSRPVKTFTI